jgi:predicted AAA+ superfamily ATPase
VIDFSEFFAIHNSLTAQVPQAGYRFLFNQIDWSLRLLGIVGSRGTGKSTLLLQRIKQLDLSPEKCLYLSADHIKVEALGLYEIGAEFYRQGGQLLYIDEIHKYKNWHQIVKNLYDSFPKTQIVFSGSSTLHLTSSKADLSRRAVYYNLPSLSFREYLQLVMNFSYPAIDLEDLLKNHTKHARQIVETGRILGHFRDFLQYGAYPFFLEGRNVYHHRLQNVVEKVLYEDLPSTAGIKPGNVPILKRMLWEISSAPPYQLNIESLASNVQTSRTTVYHYLDCLQRAGLLRAVMLQGKGSALSKKPAKLFLENSNLMRTVGLEIRLDEPLLGAVRETLFSSQIENAGLGLRVAKQGDFEVAGKYVFEIGGKSKGRKQLPKDRPGLVVKDDIEVGDSNIIPLWLFGFLY